MHLIILGLILVVGILAYYIITGGADNSGASSGKKKDDTKRSKVTDDLRKEDNVIFLPTADNADNDMHKDPDAGDPDL